ncbi:MAG: zf-HC2 domain-containing protein [Clostridiales bacterium]|nr:zf-HC2 domain-containing protein [Clostridiales bacterium]
MKCNEFENLINEYVDGELMHSIDILEEHMDECEVCKALYEETLELKKMLADLDMIELPDDFEDTLHDKLIEASRDNVRPIHKWNRNFKLVGSIAAVLLVSVLAIKSLPQMGSEDMNMAYNETSDDTAVAYSMNDSEAAMDDSFESEADVQESSVMVTGMPEAAEAKALTLRMPSQVFVNEGRTFYLRNADKERLESFIESTVLRNLEILPYQYQFYMKSSTIDEFVKDLKDNFDVTDELVLDYTYDLENFYSEYNMQSEYINQLKSDYDSAEGEIKEEIKARIDAEISLLESYETNLDTIRSFEGYKQIIIITNEE